MTIPRWIKSLKIIFKPSYWHRTYKYDELWDDELQTLMALHRFEPIYKYTGDMSEYHCKLGDLVVWIENHPFASYSKSGHISDYPLMCDNHSHSVSRLTKYEAHKQRLRDFKYYEERKVIENRLNNGDGITPKKIKLKNELIEW